MSPGNESRPPPRRREAGAHRNVWAGVTDSIPPSGIRREVAARCNAVADVLVAELAGRVTLDEQCRFALSMVARDAAWWAEQLPVAS